MHCKVNQPGQGAIRLAACAAVLAGLAACGGGGGGGGALQGIQTLGATFQP